MTRKYKYSWSILTGMLLMLGLWTISLYNYLLFHGIAELFSIVVAWGIFMLAWNSRQFNKNSFFLFIGIAYLFVGNIDLLHMLAYKGMGILPGHEDNLASQLWIAARYLESVSLLIAPFVIGRKLKTNFVIPGYIIVTAVLLGSILYWHIFPVCFIDGVGLTVFKKASEYIISLILLVTVVVLFHKRDEFERNILRLLIASVVVTIASELAFTFYVDTYGFSNLVGHYLKIISFYFIYIAVIKTGLTRPFALLFRDLKLSEDTLRAAKEHLELEVSESNEKLQESIKQLHESELHYRSVVEDSPGLICRFDTGGLITFVNDTYCSYFGKSRQELTGTSFFSFIPEEDREVVETNIAALTPEQPIQVHEHRVVKPDGQIRWQRWTNRAIFDKDGQAREYQSFGEDITERKQAQEQLRASEEKYRFLFDSVPVGIGISDFDGNVLDGNRAMEQMTGYNLDELRSMNVIDTYAYPEDREELLKALREQGEVRDWEYRFKTKDGSIRYFLMNAEVIVRDGRQALLITTRDITERKRVEKALEESHEKLIKAEQIARMGFLDWDLKTNKIVWSREVYNLYGVDPGMPVTIEQTVDLVHPDDREFVKKNLDMAIQGISDYDIDHRIVRTDGKVIWVHARADLERDEKGIPVLLLGTVVDITERKKAVETLARSEERYRGIFDESIASIYVFDEKKNFINSNQAGLDLLGYSRDELLSMSIPDVDADPVVVLPAHEQLLSGGKIVNYEHRLRRKDGTVITVLNNSRPLTDTEGNVIGMQSTLIDITERKKAEEALRESEDRFRNIFNHAMVGLYRTTPDGRVLMANPTILKMLGYESFEELTKRNLDKEGFEPGYSRSDFKKRIETEGQVMGFEATWTRRDNTTVYIRESAWPIRDEFGNIIYYEGIIEDITEQKQAQKALDESAARLQLATSATRIGNWDWDLRTNEVYFSPEWKRQIGYEDHEIPNRYEAWESRLHPEDKQSTVKALKDYIAGRQAEYGIEFRLRHKDGSYRWIYTRAEKQLDDTGKPCRLFGCHVDINERKKAEEELRRSEQDKTLVLDNTNEIVAYHDLDHNIQWVNKAYLKATNRTFSELKGKKCYHAWELDRLCTNCPVTKAMETGESQEAELTPQNQKHWPSAQGCWMVRAAPVRNEAGSIIGAIEVSYDITERKQTEQKLHQYQQRLKALASELTIAEERERRRIAAELHDNVQQSLALARIQLATARNCTSTDKLTAILDEISDSMRQAIQDTRSLIFDLSSPSMNEIGLAAAISEWFQEQIQERHGLKTEFIDECGRVQLDDDVRAILFRSVRELLTNVVKHAKASRVNVCLKQNGDYLEIVVRDDGVGFDYTAQSGIMGHFGLFSIQERMADLGGSLEIESKPGKESKVIIKVPLNTQ